MTDTKETLRRTKYEKKVWLWIKSNLASQELSFSKLAIDYGVKKTNFLRVKNTPSPKYELIIASKLGLDPWDLWPDRYDIMHNPSRVSTRYPKHKKIIEHKTKEINGEK